VKSSRTRWRAARNRRIASRPKGGVTRIASAPAITLPRAAPWDREPPRDSVLASMAAPQTASTGTAAARTVEVARSVHQLAPLNWRNCRAGAGAPARRDATAQRITPPAKPAPKLNSQVPATAPATPNPTATRIRASPADAGSSRPSNAPPIPPPRHSPARPRPVVTSSMRPPAGRTRSRWQLSASVRGGTLRLADIGPRATGCLWNPRYWQTSSTPGPHVPGAFSRTRCWASRTSSASRTRPPRGASNSG